MILKDQFPAKNIKLIDNIYILLFLMIKIFNFKKKQIKMKIIMLFILIAMVYTQTTTRFYYTANKHFLMKKLQQPINAKNYKSNNTTTGLNNRTTKYIQLSVNTMGSSTKNVQEISQSNITKINFFVLLIGLFFSLFLF